jgi:hypothetical protein
MTEAELRAVLEGMVVPIPIPISISTTRRSEAKPR